MKEKSSRRNGSPYVVKKISLATGRGMPFDEMSKKIRYCISVSKDEYENIRKSKNGHNERINAVIIRFPSTFSEKKCLSFIKNEGYNPLVDIVDFVSFASKIKHRKPIAALGLSYSSNGHSYIPVIKKKGYFIKKLIGYPNFFVFGGTLQQDFVVKENTQ